MESPSSVSMLNDFRALQPCRSANCCSGLCALSLGHLPHVDGCTSGDRGMGLRIQDGRVHMVQTQSVGLWISLWLGILDESEPGDLLAGYQRSSRSREPKRSESCRCPTP